MLPPPGADPSPATFREEGSEAGREIDRRLAALWLRQLPEFQARLLSLHAAAEMATCGSLSGEPLRHAIQIAHGFAGSLGMYGYAAAGLIAREIESELLLAGPRPHLLEQVAELSVAMGCGETLDPGSRERPQLQPSAVQTAD